MTAPPAALHSWKDGATKSAITDFVARVTEDGGPHYVEPAARVAVFDNDGVLWCEKATSDPARLHRAASRPPRRGGSNPEGATALSGGLRERPRVAGRGHSQDYRGDDADLHLLMGAVTSAFETVTVEEYDGQVLDFFANAEHPTLQRPHRACGFAPMVELLRYLEGNGFVTYIASAGDRDFMRPVAGEMYGIPPERVIGSALGLEYRGDGDSHQLLYKAAMDFFDDGPEKPVRIWSRIGRRPILSFGNSNGDLPMLSYSGRDGSPSLRLLLLHDDAEREFDYTAGAEQALETAGKQGWTVVSMKDDWSHVLASSA